MTFKGPDALYDKTRAATILQDYYRGWDTNDFAYTGSQFDLWPNNDPFRFSADDLVAVTFLSVKVLPRPAHGLLRSRADEFNRLLAGVPQDLDLVDAKEIEQDWWNLMSALVDLPDVGPTTASKLFARKRPRLRPIYDSVIETYLGPDNDQWEPLHRHLTVEEPSLTSQLGAVVEATEGVPSISPLRALDVICWMEGKAGR